MALRTPLTALHNLRRQYSNRPSMIFSSRPPCPPSSSFASLNRVNSSDFMPFSTVSFGDKAGDELGPVSWSTSMETSTQRALEPSGPNTATLFDSLPEMDGQTPSEVQPSTLGNTAINQHKASKINVARNHDLTSCPENGHTQSSLTKSLELPPSFAAYPPDTRSLEHAPSSTRSQPFVPSALFSSSTPRNGTKYPSYTLPRRLEQEVIGGGSHLGPSPSWSSRASSSPLESGGVSPMMLYRVSSSLSSMTNSSRPKSTVLYRSGAPFSTTAASTSDLNDPSTSGEGSTAEPAPKRRQKSTTPKKSVLKPPKPAPSSWQIYFANYLTAYREKNPNEKLNVVSVSKEAATLYKLLGNEEMEVLKKRARVAKEGYKKELLAWQKTLTPDDIRHENAFRTAQRRAGKSRRSNIKDPNAPKKPLSAYFMFLAHIRSDAALMQEVFGNETETTKQSVLAAQKWKSMTDEERKVFLQKAEAEMVVYLAKLKEYEENFATTRQEDVKE